MMLCHEAQSRYESHQQEVENYMQHPDDKVILSFTKKLNFGFRFSSIKNNNHKKYFAQLMQCNQIYNIIASATKNRKSVIFVLVRNLSDEGSELLVRESVYKISDFCQFDRTEKEILLN